MRERLKRSLGIVVVSVLMVVLAAGVALAATVVHCNPLGGQCRGTFDDDNIYGSSYVDYIKAHERHDVVDAWHGDDAINPGPGNDTVLGYYGNDYISGTAIGGNWVIDEAGDDWLYGEDGNDTIIDQVGRDYVSGGPGNDIIDVNDGFSGDYVDAGSGSDTVYADSGDTVVGAEAPSSFTAGAKSSAKQETADQQRPAPPKLSKATPDSAADEKSLGEKQGSTPPTERSPVK